MLVMVIIFFMVFIGGMVIKRLVNVVSNVCGWRFVDVLVVVVKILI